MPGDRIIKIARDADEAARMTAAEFARIAGEAIAARGRACVALAGGSTPRAAYESLAGGGFMDAIAFSNIHFFFGDERAVPPADADSNYKMALDAMLIKLRVPMQQIHRMEADAPDIEGAANRYESNIRSIVGASPAFDLILLGMGPDGHTASLFPGSPALAESSRLVAPAFGGPKPMARLSFTFPLINTARNVVITATGEAKSAALRRVFSGSADDLPVARVAPADGNMTWILDAPLAEAAGVRATESGEARD
ncbi:MAG: 6-phosphogluconolactonase [Planctomycetes bacterium]|nr:6-phosphogluconolactonase [Planctomycetota bacterium]